MDSEAVGRTRASFDPFGKHPFDGLPFDPFGKLRGR